MQRRPLAAINVTPLVDVLLILLVIVMLAMPMFVKKLPVELPKTGINSAPAAVNSLRVSMTASGQLILNDKPATLAQVLSLIKTNTSVELAVDEQVTYGAAAELIAKLQDKQPNSITLLTH